MSQHRIRIDCQGIHDWASFHDVLAAALVLPTHYGRNINALIDFLTNAECEVGAICADANDSIVLELSGAETFRSRAPEAWAALIDAVAFTNLRRLESGEPATIMLAFRHVA